MNNQINERSKISVLLVEPNKHPKMVEIEDSLESMQSTVGGYIEAMTPFEDDVAIICDEEGKCKGKDLNRAIYTEDGQMIEIIAGTFFICYAPIESEDFLSLPEELAIKYESIFYRPELFFKSANGNIVAIPTPPVAIKK